MTVQEANEEIDAMIRVMRNPDFTEALEKVQSDLVDQRIKSFSESVDPDGEEWEPNVYRISGGPPLFLTGALMRSAADDAGSGVVTTNSYTTDGSRLVPYAGNMNYAEYFAEPQYVEWVSFQPPYPKVVRKNINWHPAREFLAFGEELIDKAELNGQDVLIEQIVRA